MGAYAALIFGHLCGADSVVALSPQTRFDKEFEEEINEHRWSTERKELQQVYDVAPFSVGTIIAGSEHRPHCSIYYGDQCSQDVAYVGQLAGIPSITLSPVLGKDHDAVYALRESGELNRIILASIDGVTQKF